MDGSVQPQKLKSKKVTTTTALSPLALLTLAACGGGGGGSSPTVSGSSSFSVSGNAVAGPIDGAVAFVDYDEDGTLDADEPYAYTDGDGAFALTSTDADAPIVVTTDSTTAGGLAISAIDTSSDTSLTGMTLKAPTGSSVISPTSTVAYDLMETNGLTEAEVATALGLDGVSILSFNPYADDVDADTALAVEKVASQVMTTVKAITAAAEGSGADGNAAASKAFASLVSVVQTKAAAGSSFDLSNAADLASVQTQATTELATLSGIDTTAYNAILETAIDSVEVVNTAIKNITDTDLSSSATKGVLATSEALKAQVKTAATAEKASAGSGAASITLTDADAVSTAATSVANNKAPTDIELSATSIAENSTSLKFTATTVDEDSSSFTYALSGDDADYFTIDSSTGVLTLKQTPDYETKASYAVTITSSDDGTVPKSYSEDFTITVTDDGVSPKVLFTIDLDKTGDNYLLDAALSELEDGSSVQQAFDAKLAAFNDWSSGIDSKIIELDGTETNTSVSSSGIEVTFGSGYKFKAEWVNFSPSSLEELVNMTDAATNLSELELSGGFKALSIIDAGGVTTAKLEHTTDGMKLVNPLAGDGQIVSLTLDGDFNNQLSDFVDILAQATESDISESAGLELLKTNYQLQGLSYQDADGDVFAFGENDSQTGIKLVYEDHRFSLESDALSSSTGGLSFLDLLVNGDELQLDINSVLSNYNLTDVNEDITIKYSYQGNDLITLETDGVTFDELAGDSVDLAGIVDFTSSSFLPVEGDDGTVFLHESSETFSGTLLNITLEDYVALPMVGSGNPYYNVYEYAYERSSTISDADGSNDILYLTTRDADGLRYFGDSYVDSGNLVLTSYQDNSKSLTIENAFSPEGRIETVRWIADDDSFATSESRISSLDDNFTGDNLVYFGTKSDDTLVMNSGFNEAYLSDGNDTVTMGDGGGFVFGDAGDDVITGNAGNDFIRGGDGADIIKGVSGNDTIYGDDGDDLIYASEKGEYFGGAGNDTFLPINGGTQTFDGGDGIDLFKMDLTEYTPPDNAMVNGKFTLEVDLENGISKALGVDHTPDTLISIENIEILGAYDTKLTGNAEDNNIKGAAGEDVIDGGAGSDTLTGNDGSDVFVVRSSDGGSDTIMDFATGDKLGLVDSLEPGDISTQVVDGSTQILYGDQLLVTLDSYTSTLTEDVDYVSYSL